MKIRSKRPYLLSALFDWIVDSGLTPYLLIAASDPRVVVPQQYVEDGKIILNVSPTAVRDLAFDDEFVRFNGRFSGSPFAVAAPMTQVLAIYAKETGEGMMFDAEERADGDAAETHHESGQDTERLSEQDREPDPEKGPDNKRTNAGAHLKIIK